MSFESASDFVNQSLRLFDFSPLEALITDRNIKLGNLTKLAMILSSFRNYIPKCNVIFAVTKEKSPSKIHLIAS